MNHQADKLREPTTQEEAETSRLGGIVIAVFACPSCGWIASQPLREDS